MRRLPSAGVLAVWLLFSGLGACSGGGSSAPLPVGYEAGAPPPAVVIGDPPPASGGGGAAPRDAGRMIDSGTVIGAGGAPGRDAAPSTDAPRLPDAAVDASAPLDAGPCDIFHAAGCPAGQGCYPSSAGVPKCQPTTGTGGPCIQDDQCLPGSLCILSEDQLCHTTCDRTVPNFCGAGRCVPYNIPGVANGGYCAPPL